ncbi:chaperonin 10-like protein [Limtongia smithiae]|uniref:chaperonin 10-like protein n=1 Tax=Limtongia smithiae TaxID=1125753 RepID=UPI0034CF161A
MRALRFYGNKDVRLDFDVPEPTITHAYDVLIAPQWCGICGSDLHEFVGGPTFCPVHPHPITGEKLPIVLGHEFSGIVLSVGSDVTNVKPGDNVCVEATLACGKCGPCKEGRKNLCVLGPSFYGLSGWGGGMAEKVVIPCDQVHKLPPGLGLDLGALMEPLSVAWHAIKLSGFEAGKTALVLGSGPIGIAAILCLQALGASATYVSEPTLARYKQALDFAADYVMNPMETDVVAETFRATSGKGVDFSYDCSGVQATFTTSIKALAPGGTATNIALWEKPAVYNPMDTLMYEKRLIGSIGYTWDDFEGVIDAVATGKLKNFGSMITARLPLDKCVSGGFEELINHKDEHIKIICTPHSELLK